MEREQLKDILLVTTDEKSLGYKWNDNADKLKGIQVISEEFQLPEFIKDVTLIGQSRGKEQVFLKDPFYESTFVEVSKAEDRIFKNKIRIYKRIALLLGAKSFTATAEIIEQKKMNIDASGNVSYKALEVNTSVIKEQNNKLIKKYEINSTLTPKNDFDRVKAFEDANNLIREHNLQYETEIVGLIENNDPSLQSRESRQTFKLELSNELNDLLEMSFNVNALGGVFALGANFKKTTETIKSIILETVIEF